MADNNLHKRADQVELGDDDPFAELTRIMGHAPRADAPAPVHQIHAARGDEVVEDFSIDLEQELMSDLADAFDRDDAQSFAPEPPFETAPIAAQHDEQVARGYGDAQAAEPYYDDDTPALPATAPTTEDAWRATAAAEPYAADDDALADFDLDAALEAELNPSLDSAGISTVQEPAADNEPLAVWDGDVHEPAPEVDLKWQDEYATAGERAADMQADAWTADDGAQPDHDHGGHETGTAEFEPGQASHTIPEPEVASFDEPVAAEPWWQEADDGDDAHAQAAEAPEFAPVADAPSEPRAFTAPAVQQHEGFDDVAAEQGDFGDDDLGMAEIDMDFEVADDIQAETFDADGDRQDPPPVDEQDRYVDAAPIATAPIAAAPVAAAPSLEDELEALLGGADEAPVSMAEAPRVVSASPLSSPFVSHVEEVPLDEAEAAPAPAATMDDWHPAVSTFGHGSHAGEWDDEASGETVIEEPVFAASAHNEPAPATGWAVGPEDEPVDAFAPEPEQDADPYAELAAITGYQRPGAVPAASHAAPAASAPAASTAPSPREWMPVAAAGAMTAAAAAWAGRRPQPASHMGVFDGPEIETTEVDEAVAAVHDDLDIPEVEYGAPEGQAARDELDLDFEDFAMEDAVADPVAAASPEPAYADDETWQAEQSYAMADDLGFEGDLEQAIAMASYEEDAAQAQQPPARRRGFMVAAVVAGVAVLGGVGVLAMGLFGDGGSDTPALVRADTDPMKVRPENPGGVTVPNQDNEVYQRVTGGENTDAPAQERLITTTEEPLDIAATEDPSTLPRSISEGDIVGEDDAELLPPDASASAGDAPKSEERFQPEPETAAGQGNDTLALAPRRVRTMIVRPDGTMVPRDMPEQEAMAADAPADGSSVLSAAPLPAAGEAASLDAPQAGAAPLAGEADATASVDTPSSVGVVPTQRVDPQGATQQVAQAPASAQQPAAAAPQPATQLPPATPVSAPAAPAPVTETSSEWSMQIASQPTAEGAQATYQDLARRYGSVLQGRSVNIVRADIAGKGVYYRVRIPTSDRDDAINLCTQYKSAGGSCFVSR